MLPITVIDMVMFELNIFLVSVDRGILVSSCFSKSHYLALLAVHQFPQPFTGPKNYKSSGTTALSETVSFSVFYGIARLKAPMNSAA